MSLDYTSLSNDQLICYIKQLETDFQDLSNNSTQVQSLLLSQIESLKGQLSDYHTIKSKVTTLEIENDLLESTLRIIRTKLSSESDLQNQYLEKIAILENDIDIFSNSNEQWFEKEKSWKLDYEELKKELISTIELNNELNNKINKLTKYQVDSNKETQFLSQKLIESNNNCRRLTIKLNRLSQKFHKIQKFMKLLKLNQSGLVKLYSTPPLEPMRKF